ncbi:MAG: TolC family protein, partial [Planctomycetes bacterium]|nr:TolC family protein [Planctomycetota bacterium]
LAEDPPYTVQTPATPPEITYQLDELWSKARLNNPELLAQMAYEKAAYAAVDKSISDLYPSVSINGSYTWSGSDFPLVWNWLLGGTVRFNIFQGFQKVNQINDSVANLRIARAQRAELEQRLYLDLNRALAQLEDATQSLRISGLAVKQAEENLILVQQRYEVGKASSVELTDAQVSLATARSNYVQAEFNYQIAIALIRKTTFEKETKL